jgi:hypothetical protein
MYHPPHTIGSPRLLLFMFPRSLCLHAYLFSFYPHLSLTSYLNLTPLSFPLSGPQIEARQQRVPSLGAAAGVAAQCGVASSASGLGRAGPVAGGAPSVRDRALSLPAWAA